MLFFIQNVFKKNLQPNNSGATGKTVINRTKNVLENGSAGTANFI